MNPVQNKYTVKLCVYVLFYVKIMNANKESK